MGLFSFFNRKNGHNGIDPGNPSTAQILPEIPEDIFLEKDKVNGSASNGSNGHVPAENGISLLFYFLERNHEAKGYDDALVNPDTVHLEQNIEALNSDLERTIRKVKTFYEDFIREIDFHIKTRSRTGMVDTVEELTMKKATAQSHLNQVIEIENQAKEKQGIGRSILISYKRGFNNGQAAISHHTILKKSF